MTDRTQLLRQIARYGSTTLLSASLSLGVPILLHETGGMTEEAAVAVGFLLSYIMNIILMRRLVFQSSNDWRGDTIRYVVTNGAMRLVEYTALIALLDVMGLDYRLCVLLILGVSTLVKFFLYRWAFGDRRLTAVDGID